MSPFKEPQPRKQPVDNNMFSTPKNKPEGFYPTYPEHIPILPWPEEKVQQVKAEGVYTMTESEFNREMCVARQQGNEEGQAEAIKDFHLTLDAARADLEVRRIALEWSVTYWGRDGDANRTSNNVVHVADKFEAYLREGKQP